MKYIYIKKTLQNKGFGCPFLKVRTGTKLWDRKVG